MLKEEDCTGGLVSWTQVSLVPSTDGSNETLGRKSSTIAYLAELETYLRAQSFPDKPLRLSVEVDLRRNQAGGASTYLTISVGPSSKKEFCLGGLSALGLQSKHGQEHIEFLRDRLIPGIIMSTFMTTTLENAKYTLSDNAPESYSVIIPKGKGYPVGRRPETADQFLRRVERAVRKAGKRQSAVAREIGCDPSYLRKRQKHHGLKNWPDTLRAALK